jgi:hypothetical protein
MDQSEKIQCPCGGQYRRSDKAKHMRTNKHMQHLIIPAVVTCSTENNIVEDVLTTIKTMTMIDQQELLRQLQILLAPKPEPEPEPEPDSPFLELQTRLFKALGEDIFVNMSNDNLDEDAHEHQEELEDKAIKLTVESDDDLWDDCMVVCRLKYVDEWVERWRLKNIAEFEEFSAKYVEPKKLMITKKLIDLTDQYNYWIKQDIQGWYKNSATEN